jgi:hypothetical protein
MLAIDHRLGVVGNPAWGAFGHRPAVGVGQGELALALLFYLLQVALIFDLAVFQLGQLGLKGRDRNGWALSLIKLIQFF